MSFPNTMPLLSLTDYRRYPNWQAPHNALIAALSNNGANFNYYNVKEIIAYIPSAGRMNRYSIAKAESNPSHWILNMGDEQYLYLAGYTYRRTLHIWLSNNPYTALDTGYDLNADEDVYRELRGQIHAWAIMQEVRPVAPTSRSREEKVAARGGSNGNKFGTSVATPPFKPSMPYVKFGADVAQHWTPPVPAPTPSPTTSATLVRPYALMHEEVQRVRLNQSTGLNKHNSAFTVEPIAGLHLLLHVSSETTVVNENDLLNGLTELLHYIHSLAKQNELEL